MGLLEEALALLLLVNPGLCVPFMSDAKNSTGSRENTISMFRNLFLHTVAGIAGCVMEN